MSSLASLSKERFKLRRGILMLALAAATLFFLGWLTVAQDRGRTSVRPSDPDDLYALQSPTGTFLSATSETNAVRASAREIGGNEQFRLVPLGGPKYAIQVLFSGRYLTATGGGGVTGARAVGANAADVGPFETFALTCTNGGKCAIRTYREYYLTAVAGVVRTDATQPTEQTLFRLLTPKKNAPTTATKPPASTRAKGGLIDFSGVAGPIISGAVGIDRFGHWEEAVSRGERSRDTNLGHDHLVVATPPRAGGKPTLMDLGSTRGRTLPPRSVKGQRGERVAGEPLETESSGSAAENTGGEAGASGEQTGEEWPARNPVEEIPEDRAPRNGSAGSRPNTPATNRPASGPVKTSSSSTSPPTPVRPTNRPTPSAPTSAATSPWNGTWIGDNNRMTFNLSGNGDKLSGSFQYQYEVFYWAGAKGSGSISNCKTSGGEAICDYSDSYSDLDKNCSSVGKITLTLGTDRLSFRARSVGGPSVSWTSDRRYEVEYWTMLVKKGPLALTRK